MNERNSFILYSDSLNIVEILTDEQAGVLFKSILRYKSCLDLPEMDGMTKLAFVTIKTYLDRDANKYEVICEKRREAGKKGGAPKGNKNADKKNNQNKQAVSKTTKTSKSFLKQPKQPDSDNDIGNEIENDNESDINNSICTEPETVSMLEPAFISLPLNDGSIWPVTNSYLEQLKALYPALDVEQEIRKMFAWLDSKPSNRKTKRGIKTFITNWLSRSQDRARLSTAIGYKTKKQKVDDDLVDFVNAIGGK